ncbi:MAG: hypothetical protein NWR72_12730, partial [Bacteroidia bacterium]|nr:hypothetical protein [Bacteroidia bacterium]
MKKESIIWLCLSIIIVSSVLMLMFREAFWHPGDFLFSPSGDGLRSYMSMAWQLNYGTGSWHEMFHYPTGNHLLYVDIDPFLLGILNILQSFGIGFEPDSVVGILNGIMIMGFIPSAIFLFLIGKELFFPSWYAALIAVCLTFMAPQVDRLTGHFAMAQLWILPAMIFALFKWQHSGFKSVWLIFYFVVSIMAAWMHPYFGLISGALLMIWSLRLLLQDQSFGQQPTIKKWVPFVVALIPTLSLSVWKATTFQGPDDFVSAPFGLTHYSAGFESVFLPSYGPIRLALDYFPIRHYTSEGYAYVGLTGLFVLLFLIGSWIRQKWFHHQPLALSLPLPLSSILWTGTILLIPAFAIPFKWVPILQELLGPIQQFRSMGRLAWVFFYGFTFLSAWIILNKWFEPIKKRNAGLAMLLLIGVTSIWLLEGYFLMKDKAEFILSQNKKNLYPEWSIKWNDILDEAGYPSSSFQAIVALPFFHTGSEKFFQPSWLSERYSQMIAIQTGIPIIENFTARASLSASRKSIQLISHP